MAARPRYRGHGVLRGTLRKIALATEPPAGLTAVDIDRESVLATVGLEPWILVRGFDHSSECPLRDYFRRFERNVREEVDTLRSQGRESEATALVSDLILTCSGFYDLSEDNWVREAVDNAIRYGTFSISRPKPPAGEVRLRRVADLQRRGMKRWQAVRLVADELGVDREALNRSLLRAMTRLQPDQRHTFPTAAGKRWFDALADRRRTVEARWRSAGNGAARELPSDATHPPCGCREPVEWECCGAKLCYACLHLHREASPLIRWAPQHRE